MSELVEKMGVEELADEVFVDDDADASNAPMVGVVLFVTRNGPKCGCGSTDYVYHRDGRHDVIARCAECHAQTGFRCSKQLTEERCVEAHTRNGAEDVAEGWV